MLRTIFLLGLFVMLGLIALKLVFGILGGLVGILFGLLIMALKIALVGLVVYVLIRIFSPETARKIRAKLSNGI